MLLFGKYQKYVIRSKDLPNPVNCEVEKAPDAFYAVVDKCVVNHASPAKVTEHTSKDHMKNRLLQALEEKKLGWSPDCVKTV